MFFLFGLLLASNLVRKSGAAYNLAQDYSGESFLDGWDFFTDADPTNGHVLYQSQAAAQAQGLIGVQNGGQMFIGVDSTNSAPNGRPAVRVSTQQTYQHGLIIADIAHQPGGICGVWPAFWMVGSNWPNNGEIDIVEGVSNQATNQMTLHTNAGPILSQTSGFSGKMITQNCDVDATDQPKNAGCAIVDDSAMTFGSDFNSAGGGVYATEWTSDFIKIWFFPRGQIPTDIQSGTPTPSESWGTPNSLFQGSFSMDQHFNNLQIVLNTAFCGDWAGATWSSTPECAALAPTCDEYVTNNPQAFKEAFWLVNSVKVYSDDGKPAVASSTAVPSPASTSATSSWLPWGYSTSVAPTIIPTSSSPFPWGYSTSAAPIIIPTSTSPLSWAFTTPTMSVVAPTSSPAFPWGWTTAATTSTMAVSSTSPILTSKPTSTSALATASMLSWVSWPATTSASSNSSVLTYMPLPSIAPTATTVVPWGGFHSHTRSLEPLSAVTDIPVTEYGAAQPSTVAGPIEVGGTKRKRHGGAVLPLKSKLGDK